MVTVTLENVHTDARREESFEFVQLTYDILRTWPGGDIYAVYANTTARWITVKDKKEWSDVTIGGK